MGLPTWIARATHAQLARFVWAVDTVMDADELTTRERCDLIDHWAYQFERPDMPEQMLAAIKRCQVEPVHPTATSIVNAVSGEVVAYNPG